MVKKTRTPLLIMIAIISLLSCISIAFATWIITGSILIKPDDDSQKVIIKYLDGQEGDYDGNILLPSDTALGLVDGDLTYYYKISGSSDDYVLVNEELKQGPIDADNYLIKVDYKVSDTLTESYDGIEFVINKATIDVSGLSMDDASKVYNRSEQIIEVSGTLPKGISSVSYTGGITNVGSSTITAKFTLESTKNYNPVSDMTAVLTITPKDISSAVVSFTGYSNNSFNYTGSEIGDINSKLSVVLDGYALIKGTEYICEFSELVAIGSYSETITGTGNYTGTVTVNYDIVQRSMKLIVEEDNNTGNQQRFTYDGTVKYPSYIVKDENDNIITDATITYSENPVNSALYNLTITASKEGYESGSKNIQFYIEQATITLSWSNTTFTYDKTSHYPTVSHSETVASDNVSISVSGGQVNAGTYTATAVLSQSYQNYVLDSNSSCAFTIAPRTITLASGLYNLDYSSSVRTWSQIISPIASKLTFNNVISGDTLNQTVLGMHNGVYAYGEVSVTGLDTSMTNVVGSTYQATVSISNNNYVLNGNKIVLKYKTALINGIYYTIEDAFSQSGTISFAGDATSASTYVATCFTKLTAAQGNPYNNKVTYDLSGSRKLLVPFEASTTNYNSSDTSSGSGGNVYSALIIPSGITINVNSGSSLVTGAKIGYRQAATQDAVTNARNRGVLINNGTIICNSGGNIYSYGFIKGSGTLTLKNGAVATDCMAVYDFSGGTAASSMRNDVLPMTNWTMHNISCETTIYSGATYNAFAHFVISSSVVDSTVSVIAPGTNQSANSIFIPTEISDSNYIVKKTSKAANWSETSAGAVALTSITGSNQITGQKDVFEIYGNYKDATLKITIRVIISISLTTKKNGSIPCPMSYCDVIVKDGSHLNISSSDYAFLPGTKIEIEKGATVDIGTNVHLSMMKMSDFTEGYFYKYCVDKTDAKCIVNGTLNINGGYIGGEISSTEEGAVLNLGSASGVSTKLNVYYQTSDPYYKSYTPNATGTIDSVADSALTKAVYVSATTDNTNYFWTAAENVKTFKLNFYDSDGTTLLKTLNISVVNADTYDVTGSEFTPSKMHYKFVKWLNMDGSAFSGATLDSVTDSINLKASWDETTYTVLYNAGYGRDSLGNVNYLFEEDGVVYDNKLESFTISSLVNNGGVIPITTTASYEGKRFYGWFVGLDNSVGIIIDSLTVEQLEYIVANSGLGNSIPLYCEFSDNPIYNVVLDDTVNNVIAKSFYIESNSTILDSGFNIPEFSTIDFDDDPGYELYFNGFYVDANNNYTRDNDEVVYSIDELEQLTITSNMTFYVFWDDKCVVEYKDNIGDGDNNDSETLYIKPGADLILKQAQSPKVVTGTSYDTEYTFTGWNYNGDSVNASQTVNITSDTELVAEYSTLYIYELTIKPDDSTVSFNFNGVDKTVTSDTTISYKSETNDVSFDISFTITPNDGEVDKITATIAGEVSELSKSNPSIKFNAHSTIAVTISSGCIAAGTLITLADGTMKPVEKLTINDLLLVFNHETGAYEAANIIFIDDDGWNYYNVLNLLFSNNYSIKVIYEHGFFDLDLGKYVYITLDNYHEFIGHRFAVTDVVDGEYIEKVVTLENAYIQEEYTGCYSPVTVYHLNYFTNGLLSMPGGITGLFNMFEFNEDMVIDKELMEQDIEKYGLYTYEDFEEYIPYEIYSLFPAPYLKVSVEKGIVTFEEIIGYIDRYLQKMLDSQN